MNYDLVPIDFNTAFDDIVASFGLPPSLVGGKYPSGVSLLAANYHADGLHWALEYWTKQYLEKPKRGPCYTPPIKRKFFEDWERK